ncbi:Secretory protein kinase [archaeon GW2011_AR15]|nr:Secretory protein kinase [archaeon GW2011_AR15]MBS3103762.1 CpaF family protein [Candidatus Woesearchaeota archaeon]
METKAIDSYKIYSEKIPLQIHIYSQRGQPVPFYHLSLLNITPETKRTIERIRNDIITGLSFDISQKQGKQGEEEIKEQFREKLSALIEGQFAGADQDTVELITDYIITTSLGLAELEFLLNDQQLEEIVINGAGINVWVYHKKYGWLKTNIVFNDENKIRHFATIIGRNVDRGISLLDPLLDAHLKTGDRVNATLAPITTAGNTLTIRKFSKVPWTITTFLKNKTIDYNAAALIWQAMQYELSILVVGGTGSGKTSFMNVISGFFPPNQRIISIEDTRELQLPATLHWVPMQSRLPNPEGKGEITMLDCMINALRMRPDRIIVGEVRREKELEVMFEALHTGHSVYSTFHASNVNETIARLANPPINLARQLLASLDLIVVQHRNRRTGVRRTFQVAELDESGNPKIIMQHNNMQDRMSQTALPQRTMATLMLYSGMSQEQISTELQEKISVLKWLVARDIEEIGKVGLIISDYYTEKQHLLDLVKKNKDYVAVK